MATHSHKGLNLGPLYVASPRAPCLRRWATGAGASQHRGLGGGCRHYLVGAQTRHCDRRHREHVDSRPREAQGKAVNHKVSHDDLDVAAEIDAATSALILQPARRVAQMRPDHVALEQVPGALPVFEAYAIVLRNLGWSAWWGVERRQLRSAADASSRNLGGVAARRGADARPTHAEHLGGLFGDLLPWVTIADALGWGLMGRANDCPWR